MDEGTAYAGMIGAFFKHVIPSKKVNRFIPLLAYAGMFGINMGKGLDVGQAATKSVVDVLTGMGGHKFAKTTVFGDVAFVPGYNGQKNKL